MSKNIKFISQRDNMDCGPACLAMISLYYNKEYSIEYLRNISFITKNRVSFLGLKEAAGQIGLDTISTKLTLNELINKIDYFPCILHWNQKHFVVLYSIKRNQSIKYFIADPEFGKIKLTQEKFKNSWISDDDKGVVLFLNPTAKFYQKEPPKEDKFTIGYLLNYLKPYNKELLVMFLLLFLSSALTLVLPFLTEALIDKGINSKDLHLIFIILLAQLALFLGSIIFNVFRDWLVLYIGTHLSITILSNFLKKC